tara:strand:- start:415 stop:1452 length:1038 start_codon:yes stop_codon:yes gene_type:complete
MMTHKLWTAESLFNELKDVTLGGNVCLYTLEICEKLAPIANKINDLKRQRNAIVLAHSYVAPEIIRCVADFVGDSYELSKLAKQTKADTIIFAAVKFMAETAKLLSPQKDVLIPSSFNGCSLADSITAQDIRQLRKQYPNYTFICYINTSVAVKAECDICVTSSNVYSIVEHVDSDYIYFLPDKLMGQNVVNELKRRGVNKTIKYWEGTCYVHEEYEPEMVDFVRAKNQGIKVVSHPECRSDVVDKTDFVGSTSQMINYVKQSDASSFFLLTECGLTSRLQTEVPEKSFKGTCTMCKYMKANSLDSILAALEAPTQQQYIYLDPQVQQKALKCIDNMFKWVEAVT